MTNKVLYLEKRGCDFFKGDDIEKFSDVGNYRVGSYDSTIKGKDGINYIIEFGRCDKRRFTNKRTGAPLKKFIVEHSHKLHIDTQYDKDGMSYRNLNIENVIYNMELDYTLKDILTAVNLISIDTYTSIEFIN